MIFELQFTPTALADIEFHKKSGNKAVLKKLNDLLQELVKHPMAGTGKPEELRYKQTNCWSRKLSDKHRLIYIIDNEIVAVLILQTKGHYSDK